jgi:pseudaminic acid biosynthesis-associated methylase
MANGEADSETQRLEQLWRGDFGDAYVDRNIDAYNGREPFWTEIIGRLGPSRVLEIGCNIGGNLRWIAPHLESGAVFGIDVNLKALDALRTFVPDVNAVRASARELPFRDQWFDLVFTMGVLIHQPDESLPDVMAEMARCSSRFVLIGEYFAPEDTEVPYRGVDGALFKRDYGRLFLETNPSATLVESGFMGAAEGFDDITWWLFQVR